MAIEKIDHKDLQLEPSRIWGGFSLGLGITSIVICLMPYFGLPMAIMSIVCNIMQRKKVPTGVGTAGMILGIIGIVINSVMLLLLVFVFFLVGF